MLVARRDPPFHVDARDDAPAYYGAYPEVKAPRIVRFVTAIQMIGSLLAVPVGIASAIRSIVRIFLPKRLAKLCAAASSQCSTRVSIRATRRILVRRDVEVFEKTCGSVDPEATAAFKTLLAADKAPVPLAAAADLGIARPARSCDRKNRPIRSSRISNRLRGSRLQTRLPKLRLRVANRRCRMRNGLMPYGRLWSRTNVKINLLTPPKARPPGIGRICSFKHADAANRRNVYSNVPRRAAACSPRTPSRDAPHKPMRTSIGPPRGLSGCAIERKYRIGRR